MEKTSNHQDQTFPLLSLTNMIVLDEWTNSDSEPKMEIPAKNEPKITDQNCFQDTEQQEDSGSGKQPEIKKEPKVLSPVKTEPKITDQNCFQDTEQKPDSGSGKQPEIKKEPKVLSPVKTEPKITDQNFFQDTEQKPDSGSGKQPKIKKEPVEELEPEPESNLPIKMHKGFVFPKPVPSVIPVIKNEPLADFFTT